MYSMFNSVFKLMADNQEEPFVELKPSVNLLGGSSITFAFVQVNAKIILIKISIVVLIKVKLDNATYHGGIFYD